MGNLGKGYMEILCTILTKTNLWFWIYFKIKYKATIPAGVGNIFYDLKWEWTPFYEIGQTYITHRKSEILFIVVMVSYQNMKRFLWCYSYIMILR